MRKRVGILDVAEAAGVSVTTVSHALSGRGQVSAATRTKVEQVAGELGYSPDRIASALRRRRTGIIGFVTDEIATTPFAGRIVLGAQHAAAERGALLTLVNSGGDPALERQQIAALLAQRVDAVVYATMRHRHVTLPDLLTGVPTVLVDAVDPASATPAVVPDEPAIGRIAALHLLGLGHRRIAHITIDDRDDPAAEGRIEGYRQAMAEHDAEPLVVRVPVPGDAQGGRAGFARAREVDAGLTAACAFNDRMAMGVLQAAWFAGLAVPRDLSVIGVDNMEIIAAEVLPALTTVALPHYEMGRDAVQRALDLLDNGDRPAPQPLRPQLVHRDSVAPPRPGVA